MVDNSIYKDKHDKVINYVKKQIGIDLNNYRSGDGTKPSMTTYWDVKGIKVCLNWKEMPEKVRKSLEDLVYRYSGNLVLETGGAWFRYIYFIEDVTNDRRY